MADFCTFCTRRLFGDGVPPDIDPEKIHKTLRKDHWIPVLCEGCGLNGVGDQKGEMVVIYIDDTKWVAYNEQDNRERYFRLTGKEEDDKPEKKG